MLRPWIALLPLLCVLSSGCKHRRQATVRGKGVQPATSVILAGADAAARKARSEASLRKDGVKVNPALPPIVDRLAARLRPMDEAVDRAFAFVVVASKADGLPSDKLGELERRIGATVALTPAETAFMQLSAPDEKTNAERLEAAMAALDVLHWALSRFPELEVPGKVPEKLDMLRLVRDDGPDAYRKGARYRSLESILDAADLAYRQHWACTDARANAQPDPQGLRCAQVADRHRTFRWLLGPKPQAWEAVTLEP
jgi:hypothetical protein